MLCSTVLNAFRHHSGSHFDLRSRCYPGRRVLNAFRHHSGSHVVSLKIEKVLVRFRHHSGSHSGSVDFQARMCCAQRLSASQRFSLRELPVLVVLDFRVLNAFRHHSGSHSSRSGSSFHCSSCAQRGGSHCQTMIARLDNPSYSAQRLSASQRFSLLKPTCDGTYRLSASQGSHFGSCRMLRIMCSTPFGITAVLTPNRKHLVLSDTVLNAFRHHSGSHFGSFGYGAHNHVLNAFRHPASQDQEHPHHRAIGEVLNAFRHHSGSHPSVGPSSRPIVIGPLCSTPFGITAVLTSKLNRRSPRVSCSTPIEQCSTPFGITAVLTFCRPGVLPTGAQRLSASQRFSLKVPSIPWGISAAQRLSASQRFSPLLCRRKRQAAFSGGFHGPPLTWKTAAPMCSKG